MKGKIAAVALVAASALTLAGCGGNPGGQTSGGSTDSSAPAASAALRVWLVGTDTPQEARDYLKTTFEKENAGSTLTIEEQSWTGLVDKYMTALSGSNSPDVVEIGNTQVPAFTAAGAFLDLTDKYEELGGDDMLKGFVDAGSDKGKFYAAPYYSGARVVTYSTDIVSGDVPTTWDAYLTAAKAAKTDTVSGMYLTGKDWRDMMTFVWVNGAEIATQDSSGKWTAGFNTPEGIKGLQQAADTYNAASLFPKDAVEGDQQIPFCEGKIAYLPAPSWVAGMISAPEDAKTPGCASTFGAKEKLHQFAAPGLTAGTYAPVLAGGSNIAVPAKAKNTDLAYKAMQIMLSDGYQKILAEAGMVPALTSQAQFMADNENSKAAQAAASAAISTPAAEKWADVEASQILEDSFSKLVSGTADAATIAKELDDKINATLNG
ncbi:MAG: extracellular solute-binding protein [Propionibacteriaceae bacterium]|jgi:N,N'-diacetylchitobiose transport system substrate-binding protein|nr:extracellular solute-binding protein [Propionibacteriaceae bacterium]